MYNLKFERRVWRTLKNSLLVFKSFEKNTFLNQRNIFLKDENGCGYPIVGSNEFYGIRFNFYPPRTTKARISRSANGR